MQRNVTGRQRQVHLMFCEVPTDDPSICGPNRPLIGAVLHEEDAVAAEDRHPGAGVHWIAARARRGETYRLWRVPLGPVDIERPVWTDETTVRGD